tara:strand:- start:139 stop:441 length:303 start_codon:yes stop_codon:yes gene_type:complete
LTLWSQKTAETSGIESLSQVKALHGSAKQASWRLSVKVGDIVKYGYAKTRYGHGRDDEDSPAYGTIIYVNEAGGTLKVLDQRGKIDWFVTSYCEVISESR